MIRHPIPPFYGANATILILGSFPSVKSREVGFFYGHPQNRFWRVTAAVFEDEIPDTVEAKKAFLTRHGIALWDVIGECEIVGSSDASIKNAKPNDLAEILANCDIRAIFVNGKTAAALYEKHIFPTVGRAATVLPSTSPANAAWALDRLTEAWKIIRGCDLCRCPAAEWRFL